jgi:hypothetical protein
MPELNPSTVFLLRAQLRRQLLRAAEALADERVPDEDALALTRNAAVAVTQAIDTVDRPAYHPAA